MVEAPPRANEPLDVVHKRAPLFKIYVLRTRDADRKDDLEVTERQTQIMALPVKSRRLFEAIGLSKHSVITAFGAKPSYTP